MVKDFIGEKRKTISDELSSIKKELNANKRTQEIIEEKIKSIQADGEMSAEYFSPRNSSHNLREKISQLYERLDIIREKNRNAEEKIKFLESENNKFQQMWDEIEELERKANVSRET